MSQKTADGPFAYAKGADTVDIAYNLLTGDLTLTNELQAEGFLGANNGYIYKLDLRPVRQVRLLGRIKTASASANTPVIKVKYYTAFSTTVGDYLALGESAVQFSIFTGQTYGDSGWITIANGARIDGAFVALMSQGGDGAADPIVSNLILMCR